MKKTMITLSTGALLLFGSLTTPFGIGETTAMAQQTMSQSIVTIKSTVNVRTGPSTNHKIMGKLYTGAQVNLVEQVNSNWIKVERDGKTGYISARFAEFNSTSPTTPAPKPSEQNTEPPKNVEVQLADQIINLGQEYIGTKYQFGAKTGNTNSFDCSSFVQYIFGKNDVSLPRSSRSQASVGTSISSVDNLQKGDLIFFKTGNRSDGQIDHVAVYMGDGKIIHAIPSKGVTIDNFSGFWLKTAVSAKRVLK